MDRRAAWWETRTFVVALVLLAAVPLLWPAIPPLIDLPGHMGRYRIQIGFGTSPFLSRWFDFRWGLIGNLGVDLLTFPLGALLGLEPAVKLIVICIPVLTVAGLLAIAHEAHRRIPPTTLFALPLAYCYPVHFGFVNFDLAMVFALLGFALWLRLGRRGRTKLRAALFVPLAVAIWVTHGFGWVVLCLLALAAEMVRARDAGNGPIATVWGGGLACLPLAPPILLVLLWREGDAAGVTADFFNGTAKYFWLASILRDRWMAWDLFGAALLCGLAMAGVPRKGLHYDRTLGAAAAMLTAAFLLVPRILIGSAYADTRLAPYAVAIALIALTPTQASPRAQNLWAAAGLAFLLARTASTTASFALYDSAHRAQLAAIDHLPMGARVYARINLRCNAWGTSRMEHLASIAIVRRDAFVNDQWVMPGAQLIRLRPGLPAGYSGDPSQMLVPQRCRFKNETLLEPSLDKLPRDRFDYVWVVDLPPAQWPKRDWLAPVWHGRTGILYRITGSATTASDTPNGSERRATQPASAPNTASSARLTPGPGIASSPLSRPASRPIARAATISGNSSVLK